MIAALSLAVLLATAPAVPSTPVLAEGHADAAVQGVWRSRGYGWVLEVRPDGLQLWHEAGDACWKDPRGPGDPDGLFKVWGAVSRDAVAFAPSDHETRYVFDRLSALPAACRDGQAWPAARVLDAALDTFRELYPTAVARQVNWDQRAATARARLGPAPDEAALFAALEGALGGLDDPHVELAAGFGGGAHALAAGPGAPTLARVADAGAKDGLSPREAERRWLRAWRDRLKGSVLGASARQAANDRVIWGRIGDVGYVTFLTMGGFSAENPEDVAPLHAALDEAIASFAGTRAVIVDVSNNRGGYDEVSRQIAGRFASERRLAYEKRPFGAPVAGPQAFYVEPSERSRYTGPVYLLTSDVTVSAGENFALYMRALPNVRHVGTTTRGALSDQIPKPLPNGWDMALPAELYLDPQGRNFEPGGVPAEVPLEVFPADDLDGGHAAALYALAGAIRAGTIR